MPGDWQRSLVQEVASTIVEFASPCFNVRVKKDLSSQTVWEQEGDPILEPDEKEQQARIDRRNKLQKYIDEIPTLELESGWEGSVDPDRDDQIGIDSPEATADSVGVTQLVGVEMSAGDILKTRHSSDQRFVAEGSVVSYRRLDTNQEHTIRLRHLINSALAAVDQRNAMPRADVGSPRFRALIGREVDDECEVEILEKGQSVSFYMVKILGITSFRDYLGNSLG